MKYVREIVLIFVFILSSLTIFSPFNQRDNDLVNQINDVDPSTSQTLKFNENQSDYNKKNRYTQLQNPGFGSQVFKFTNEFLGIETDSLFTGDSIFALSPDSRLMVSAYDYQNYNYDPEISKYSLKSNYSIYFWDLTTGDLLAELNEFNGSIQALEISPDGLTLAIVYYEKISEKTFLQFRFFSSDKILEYEICDLCAITDKVNFSPNSELFAFLYTGLNGYDDEIKLFNLKTESWLPSIKNAYIVRFGKFLFTPSSSKIIFDSFYCFPSHDGVCRNQISLYNINTRNIEHRIDNYYVYLFNDLAIATDGSKLVTSNGSTVSIWNTSSWLNILIFQTESANVNALAFSKDNNLLFTGMSDSRILIWDLINNSLIKTLNGHRGSVSSLTLSADKTMLISGGLGFTIIFWNIIRSESLLWSLPNLPSMQRLIFPTSQIYDINDDVLAVSQSPNQINIHNIRSNSYNSSIPINDYKINEYFLNGFDVSVDKNLIILGYSSGKIIVWNSTTGTEITNFDLPNRKDISFIKFSPDSSFFATLSKDLLSTDYNQTRIIEFWNTTTFTKIGNSIIEDYNYFTTNFYQNIYFSPDGKLIANLKANNNNIIVVNLWNVTDGRKSQSIKPCGNFNTSQCHISSFNFSPNGSTMAFAKIDNNNLFKKNNSIIFWDYKTNLLVNSSRYDYENVNSMEFSKDGKYLFTVSGTVSCCGPIETIGNLKIWKTMSDGLFLQNVYQITDSPIVSIKISNDGSRLAISINEPSGLFTIKMLDISKFPLDIDEDLDGLADEWENNYNLSTTNYWNKFGDDDQDGLINSMEFYFGTNPHLSDTNGNGILDGREFGFYPIPFSNIGWNTPQDKQSFNFDPILIFLTFIALSGWILYAGIILFRKRFQQKSNTKTLTEFVNTLESSFIKTLYFKIVVGLENVKKFWFIKYPDDELDIIINKESNGYTKIVDLFPLDIQKELKSELRGRTILILIELAYQFPKQAHITAISKALEIPQATVSFEIKKLLTLQYIEKTTKLSNLQDTRFKYYSLTAKGTLFLHLLKESLIQGLELLNKPT